MDESREKSERHWRKLQQNLGYTDEELKTYRSFPQHGKAMQQVRTFVKNRVIIEIIEAHNCGMGYKAGDKFVIDEFGRLVVAECPPNLCVNAISAFEPLLSRMWQAFYDGSTEVFHDTVRCPDVGVRNGGTGEITMRVRAVPRE